MRLPLSNDRQTVHERGKSGRKCEFLKKSYTTPTQAESLTNNVMKSTRYYRITSLKGRVKTLGNRLVLTKTITRLRTPTPSGTTRDRQG